MDKVLPSQDLKEITILYVEDEEIIRDSLSSLIRRHVKNLYTAKNGHEGLESYIQHRPDIVITDIQMPYLNGLEMSKEIRELEKSARIIITTAFGDSDYLLSAIDLEVNGYMIKPINRNKLFSLLNDSTKYVLSEKRKVRLQKYAQQILDFQSNMVAVLNEELNIIKCNKSFLDFFGLQSSEEFATKLGSINDVIIKFEKQSYVKELSLDVINSIVSNPANKHILVLNDEKSKKHLAFVIHANILINEYEENEYIISLTDVTALEDENIELEQKALIDKLTGIYNRHKFDDVLASEIEDYRKSGKRFSIVFFDIDHFKRVNDTYGHDIGDEILKEFASVVKKDLRASDTFARWGGEEFVVLMPNCDLKNGQVFAERLRKDIESYSFIRVGKVTSSFGVATIRPEDNKDSFTKRVDEALYVAKNSGRNMVVLESAN